VLDLAVVARVDDVLVNLVGEAEGVELLAERGDEL
jgi:hypothetical protein